MENRSGMEEEADPGKGGKVCFAFFLETFHRKIQKHTFPPYPDPALFLHPQIYSPSLFSILPVI